MAMTAATRPEVVSPTAAGAGPGDSPQGELSPRDDADNGAAYSSPPAEREDGGRGGAKLRLLGAWRRRRASAGEAAAAAQAAVAAPRAPAGGAGGGGCPPYGVKAVAGLRFLMEDQWAAVPALAALPPGLDPPLCARCGGAFGGGAAAPCACASSSSDAGSAGGGPAERAAPRGLLARIRAGHSGPRWLRRACGALGGGGEAADHLHYFAVFDGHGGEDVAKRCARRVHVLLEQCIRAALAGSEAAAPPLPPPPPPEGPAGPPKAPPRLLLGLPPEGEEGAAAGDAEAAVAAGGAAGKGEGSEESPASSAASAAEPLVPCALPPLAPLPPPGPDGTWLLASLARAFVCVDREVEVGGVGKYQGTTAAVVLLSARRIWVAHAGDSRAVLARRGGDALELTSDHKARREDEAARVRAAGGQIWFDRVMGELAVSRAIGDHCLRPYVVATPEVSFTERRPEDECIVIASDGLWDVFSSAAAASAASARLAAAMAAGLPPAAAARKAAGALAREALARGSRDNITVLVVDLRPHGAPAGAAAGGAAERPGAPAAGEDGLLTPRGGGAGSGAGGSFSRAGGGDAKAAAPAADAAAASGGAPGQLRSPVRTGGGEGVDGARPRGGPAAARNRSVPAPAEEGATPAGAPPTSA